MGPNSFISVFKIMYNWRAWQWRLKHRDGQTTLTACESLKEETLSSNMMGSSELVKEVNVSRTICEVSVASSSLVRP